MISILFVLLFSMCFLSELNFFVLGSATQQGKFPWYGERCASTMATTYSSGSFMDEKIVSFKIEYSLNKIVLNLTLHQNDFVLVLIHVFKYLCKGNN